MLSQIHQSLENRNIDGTKDKQTCTGAVDGQSQIDRRTIGSKPIMAYTPNNHLRSMAASHKYENPP
jgi:hypothetical protein